MKNKNRFITGYSGLRSLAVIGVILYHLNPNVFIGGYLGVLIFFVLSGYLVTDHMLFSYQTYGKYSNRLFYLKRIKKLYPQLISVLWISGAYILIFQRDILSKFNEIVLANLFNVYNIWQIFNGQSYFERFASNESPFIHLWTMSILGQFYLLWPIIMYILVYKLRTKKELFITISVLTILSAIEMALLYKPGVDTSRIYYGTDTRFFALGIGALLAIVCPTNRLRIGIKKNNTILLDSLGAVSFIGMFILATNQCMNPMQAFPYMGGMFIFSILTAIMVAIIANPHSHWNLVLTNPIFNWIGSRSYGIYLYQFPIMIFFESQAKNLAYNVFFYRVSEIILILLISELSYRLIEKPFGSLKWYQVHDFTRKIFTINKRYLCQKLVAMVGLIIFILGTIAIFTAPTVKAKNADNSPLARQIKKNRRKQLEDNKKIIAKAKANKVKLAGKEKIVNWAKRRMKANIVNKDFERYGISQLDLQLAQKLCVTAIGDSVMAGSSQNLKKMIPSSLVDATVSRQLVPTINLFEKYKQNGALYPNVLIGLGTNGPFKMSDVDNLMRILGDKRRVFWVNVYVPSRSWQQPVNQLLSQAEKKYKNLYIINWNGFAKNHSKLLYADHTHPNVEGSKYYSVMITKYLVEHGKF